MLIANFKYVFYCFLNKENKIVFVFFNKSYISNDNEEFKKNDNFYFSKIEYETLFETINRLNEVFKTKSMFEEFEIFFKSLMNLLEEHWSFELDKFEEFLRTIKYNASFNFSEEEIFFVEKKDKTKQYYIYEKGLRVFNEKIYRETTFIKKQELKCFKFEICSFFLALLVEGEINDENYMKLIKKLY